MTKSESLAESKNGRKPTEKIPKASQCANHSNKSKAQQKNKNHASTIHFEEKIYRGDLENVVNSSSTAKPANGLATAEVASNSSNPTSNHTDANNGVPLPSAVRSCWPDLFPTMSSTKKSIRKGIFFVKQQQQQHQSTTTAGPDATAICSGESSSDQNKSSVNHPQQEQEPPPRPQLFYKPPFKGKCGTRVAPGDLLLRKLPAGGEPRFQSRGPSTEEIMSRAMGGSKLQIAYLDQHLAVVVKPHGMPVHKIQQGGKDNDDDDDDENDDDEDKEGGDSKDSNNNNSSSSHYRPVSMHEMLLHCLPMSKARDPLRRPAAVHRLDRPTYGLLVVARTRPCARFLSQAFVERTRVKKCYKAILHGHLAMDGNSSSSNFVRKPLGGKNCVSEYSIVKNLVVVSANKHAAEANIAGGTATPPTTTTAICSNQEAEEKETPLRLTLVDLILHTGRKHQLRKHMASLGHPIVGDTRYGNSDQDEKLTQLLSSYSKCEGVTKSATKPSSSLPLLLAAVNITFPHPEAASETDTTNNNIVEEVDLKHCTVSSESKKSLDASRGNLNVAIIMPESMMNILRNSKGDETCT